MTNLARINYYWHTKMQIKTMFFVAISKFLSFLDDTFHFLIAKIVGFAMD